MLASIFRLPFPYRRPGCIRAFRLLGGRIGASLHLLEGVMPTLRIVWIAPHAIWPERAINDRASANLRRLLSAHEAMLAEIFMTLADLDRL